MKLKSSSLELYNARNAKDFPIFTMLIKNARYFFLYFSIYQRRCTKWYEKQTKHQFENGEMRAETKKFHSTQNKPNKTQTNEEIPQIKEISHKIPKQAM